MSHFFRIQFTGAFIKYVIYRYFRRGDQRGLRTGPNHIYVSSSQGHLVLKIISFCPKQIGFGKSEYIPISLATMWLVVVCCWNKDFVMRPGIPGIRCILQTFVMLFVQGFSVIGGGWVPGNDLGNGVSH